MALMGMGNSGNEELLQELERIGAAETTSAESKAIVAQAIIVNKGIQSAGGMVEYYRQQQAKHSH